MEMGMHGSWAWAAAVGLVVSGCTQVPPQAVFACGSGCPTGQMCRNGFCFPEEPPVPDGCVPTTCAAQDAGCGPISNGCGQVIQCGACPCVPLAEKTACQIAGVGCGTILRANGCDAMATYTCGGTCPADGGTCAGETDAQLCAMHQYLCGPLGVKDKCGVQRLIDCGTCGANQTCFRDDELADGGAHAQCGTCIPDDDATICNAHGASCGQLPMTVKDNCGAMRTVQCGACVGLDGGEACGLSMANQCTCQELLQGCQVAAQCCRQATCRAGLCCMGYGQPCNDEADCCQGTCAALADGGGAVCAAN